MSSTLETDALVARVRAFLEEVVMPAEPGAFGEHGVEEDVRARLQAEARARGLLAPQAPERFGGLGLPLAAQAPVLEAAGYSLLGPHALNCAAPDEGNMHLLSVVATKEQQARYLAPLVAGETRSCFAMTEPAPGAGSDPSMLQTRARRVPGGWAIDGRKWFITGALGAAFAIVLARTDDDPAQAATMLLVDAGNPGFRVARVLGSTDRAFAGGHAEVVFDDCRVEDDAVLGQVGGGFRQAQVRLVPARLTHCMRWSGIGQRALDLALDRAQERSAFGQRLAERGMVQAMLADSQIDLHAGRALIREAAAAHDAGEDAREASAIAKVFVSEAVGRVVDRAIQICGSLGVSDDLPLGRFAAEVRPFRIYDGPSETHRWWLARRILRRRRAERVDAAARS
jgi:acyl-CoA dehydrogenase